MILKRNYTKTFSGLAARIISKMTVFTSLQLTNYIAYDLLMNKSEFAKHYTEEEKTGFQTYMESRLSQMKGDSDFVHHTFLKMYANPVINKLAENNL